MLCGGIFDPAMAMKTRDVQHHDAPTQVPWMHFLLTVRASRLHPEQP
jgi:hypothetical protein